MCKFGLNVQDTLTLKYFPKLRCHPLFNLSLLSLFYVMLLSTNGPRVSQSLLRVVMEQWGQRELERTAHLN